jgi:hypothetical protein
MNARSLAYGLTLTLLVLSAALQAGEPPVLKSVPDGFTTVELRPFVNMGWADETAGDGKGGWTDQGSNDMANAPVGLRKCRGIPFDLIDAAKNDGKSVIVLKSEKFKPGLASVTVPLGGAKAQRIYVLQAAAWLSGGAAKFTLVYEDGTKSKTLQAWENIRVGDWWNPEDGNRYKVAFTTRNAVRDRVGMFAMEWKNEHPEKPLKSLLIESYNKQTVMIIAAVTLSRKDESAFTGTGAAVAAPASGGKTASPRRQTFFYPPTGAYDHLRNMKQVHERREALKKLLGKPDAADAVARYLLEPDDSDELYARIMALAYALDAGGKPAAAAPVFDKLRAEGSLRATLIAADVLLHTMWVVGTNRGSDRAVREFPDALCERAAALLDHPDPVVQAQAEWMLTQRLRRQNAGTNRIPELFSPADRKKPWFVKWSSRPASRFLADDYCRQLIQLNRHRTIEALTAAVDDVEARMKRLLAAHGTHSEKAAERQTAFQTALKTARDAIAGGELQAAHKAWAPLRLAARQVIAASRSEWPAEGIAFFTNDRIYGGDWNVNMAVTNATNMPGGDLYWKTSADPAVPAVPFGIQKKLGDGSIRGIDLAWEADRILFSFWHQPVKPSLKPLGWDHRKNAHLYILDVATGETTQLTDTPGYNDIEPSFLPDDGVIFASDRSSFGNQCAGPFIQDKRCTTLYRLDPRRSDRPVAISNNKDFDRFPHVLNDGTVVFMHWEYQERDLYHLQNAWRCRPDGTNMDAFYKQHIAVPYSIRGVRQVPGSQVCVATAQGHHDSHTGPVIIFDPSRGINNPDTMRLVTPGCAAVEGGLGPLYGQVVAEGGVMNNGGNYIDPFPMSEKAFLAGNDMVGIGLYKSHRGQDDYSLYYIDVWGNRELIHRDREMSCFMPYPLRKRTRPPVVADTVNPEATFATAFVENVYHDLPGVKKGAVKYLRISQRLMLPAPVDKDDPGYRFNHLHWFPGDSTGVHFGYWTFAPTRTIGIVKVAEDGSAYFKVPAGTPVYLQALDENFCEVRRMRTSFTLQRGEFRGCTGCHESRLQTMATGQVYSQATLSRGPQTPAPPAWGDRRVLDYRADIQPIFDRNCVKCHGGEKTEGGLDLSGKPVAGFTRSYRALFGLKPGDPQPITDIKLHKQIEPRAARDAYVADRREARKAIKLMQQDQYPGMLVSISDKNTRSADVTQPYQFGSNKSKLIRTLLDEKKHCEEVRPKMNDIEWRMLVTWIDHNANFHSTLMDKSRYHRAGIVVRVPYVLPDPWVPADLNPSFFNKPHNPPAAGDRAER